MAVVAQSAQAGVIGGLNKSTFFHQEGVDEDVEAARPLFQPVERSFEQDVLAGRSGKMGRWNAADGHVQGRVQESRVCVHLLQLPVMEGRMGDDHADGGAAGNRCEDFEAVDSPSLGVAAARETRLEFEHFTGGRLFDTKDPFHLDGFAAKRQACELKSVEFAETGDFTVH